MNSVHPYLTTVIRKLGRIVYAIFKGNSDGETFLVPIVVLNVALLCGIQRPLVAEKPNYWFEFFMCREQQI